MFTDPTFLQAIIEGTLAVGVVVFAVAQWRNGKSAASSETVQTYKDLLEAREKKYQEKQDEMQEQINKQAAQLGEFKGLLAGKEQQIADYRKILENRSPELENALKEMTRFMKQVDGRLTDIAEHIKKPVVAESKTTTTVSKGL